MVDPRTPLPDVAFIGDEHTMLQQVLDDFRTVMLRKAGGLDEQQARITVAPSSIDMLGMMRTWMQWRRWTPHVAGVSRCGGSWCT